MPDHPFQLRAAFRYSTDKNRIDGIDAEILTGEGWSELQIGNASPGFLIFVYSLLICQHTYFHANCGERGLLLESADVDLFLHAGENWKIDSIRVAIGARLRAGAADRDTLDYIRDRMRHCPVSINLDEPSDYRIDVEFG